jgi:nitrile hydratase accessory protein
MKRKYSQSAEEFVSLLPRLNSLPKNSEGPVFSEPWEAQVFAITMHLYEQGFFEWGEWVDFLGAEIQSPEYTDRDGKNYYKYWLNALERLVHAKGLTNLSTLNDFKQAWHRAARRTPHGDPIEIDQLDFEQNSK